MAGCVRMDGMAHKAATQFPAANLWDAGMSKKHTPVVMPVW
jgi:hypothetical protein